MPIQSDHVHRKALVIGFTMTILALFTVSCADQTTPLPASSGTDELEEERTALCREGAAWPSGHVPVCWKPSSTAHANFSTWAARTRRVVEESWGRAANLTFDGWNVCGSSTTGMVVVELTTNKHPSARPIGYKSDQQSSMELNSTWSNFDTVAIHEFGHILGFRHEFVRKDNPNTTCPIPNAEVPIDTCDYVDTPFDDQSIMVSTTYCNNNTQLSAYDVIGVQKMYGRKPPGSVVGLGGRCLTISAGTPTIGLPLVNSSCDGTPKQSWSYLATSQLRTYAQGSPRCVNVGGTMPPPLDGSSLMTYICGGEPNSDIDFTGVNWVAMGNMCIRADTNAIGSVMRLTPCGSPHSKWDFLPNGSIRLNNTNFCVGMPNGLGTYGAQPALALCTGSSAQTFPRTSAGTMTYATGCLEIQNASTAFGANLILNSCNLLPAHRHQFNLSGPMRMIGGGCATVYNSTYGENVSTKLMPCDTPSDSSQTWQYYFK
jgi:hypothetical protein